MPLDFRQGVQLLVVILIVPFQYLISSYFTGQERDEALTRLVSQAANWRDHLIGSFSAWQGLCWNVWDKLVKKVDEKGKSGRTITVDGEEWVVDNDSDAVPESEEKTGDQDMSHLFGASKTPRLYRPVGMIYRIGDVVRHKHWKYRGVVIGWDEHTKAPDAWMKHMYPKEYREVWKAQPTYRILVDTRNRPAPQAAYVPQDNLQSMLRGTKIVHPMLDELFEAFDGVRYVPRPFLRRMYPLG